MAGSDYPFVLREVPSGRVIDIMDHLTDEDRKKMLGDNAVQFLGLNKLDYIKETVK